ncbi:hypothetical protein L4D06_10780 [Enterovibrio makurazakiensis]|uniref:hypothetical protein n=1 Tax=Enterovibrio makurazakiensis TaxID=2910232 RepID=UPI003D1E107E
MELLFFVLFLYFIRTPTYAGLFGFKERYGILQHTPFTKTIAVLSVVGAIVILSVYFLNMFDRSQYYEFLMLLAFVLLLAAILSLESFFSKGNYNDKSITYSTIWSGEKRQDWNDLSEVKFKGDQIKLLFADGSSIRVFVIMGGYNYMLDLLEEKDFK